MLKKKFPTFCLMLAGIATANLAQAAFPAGLYLGLGAGQAEARKYCDNITNCDSADTTIRAEVGYQFNKNLGAELGYTSFGTLFSASNADVDAKQEAHAWTASAIGVLPVAQRFNLVGRLGVARYDVTNTGTVQGIPVEDKDSTKPFYGVGVRYDLNKSWLVGAEYQIYTDIAGVDGTEDNVHGWFLGGAYRF